MGLILSDHVYCYSMEPSIHSNLRGQKNKHIGWKGCAKCIDKVFVDGN